jgi:hypothetical protein
MKWINNHEWRVVKDLEWGGCSIFEDRTTIPPFVWRDRIILGLLANGMRHQTDHWHDFQMHGKKHSVFLISLKD